jgi:hypothetical protein
MTNYMGNNYAMERGNQQGALGMMNQPLSGAGMASAFGQAPGQSLYQGQLAQDQLSSLPFMLLAQIMQSAPVAGPSYAPSQPTDLGGWLNLLSSFGSSAAKGYAAYKS